MSEVPLFHLTDISSFTNNVVITDDKEVIGDGVFDTLMETVTKHLAAQLEANRIRGEDYATLYAQLFQTVLQVATQIWLEKPKVDAQIKFLEQQEKTEQAKTKTEAGKEALYQRQIKGFDDDFIQKMAKIKLDAWAVGFSVAKDSFEAEGIPAPMQKATIDDFYNNFVMPSFNVIKPTPDKPEEPTT